MPFNYQVPTSRVYEITAAVIAVLVIVGAVIIAVISEVQAGNQKEVPSWLAAAVGAVIGFYFARGIRSTGNGGGDK